MENLRDLFYKILEIQDIFNPTPQAIAKLVQLIVNGKITPQLVAIFELEELAEAQRQLLKRAHVGKLVVVP